MNPRSRTCILLITLAAVSQACCAFAAETIRALKNADAGKNLTRYESFDDFKKAMFEE